MHRTPRRRPAFLLAVLLVVCGISILQGSGQKKRDPSIAVRFHGQVFAFDPEFTARVKIGNPPKEIIIEKIPSIIERDIASFYPYRAADGSYSVVLQLDRHGAAVLEGLSAQRLGLQIVVAVNNRPVAGLKVDKPISDGIIFIPYGLTEADIRAMGASFNLMGETEGDREARRERAARLKQQKRGTLETGQEAIETPAPLR